MKKNSMIKDALILFVITLISGVCLGGVYELTKGPIADALAKEKAAAYQAIYADMTGAQEDAALTEAVKAYSEPGVVLNEVLYAVDASGNKLGYVMSITSKEGYGGEIVLSIGVQADGTITGFQVITHGETSGFGAKCTEPEFSGQFAGLNVPEITLNSDIDQIAGATITSKAVTHAVNTGLAFAQANPIN